MVERFVKTMKEDYIAFTPKLSVSNLTMAIEHYNENHPHSAQDYLLPGEISTSAGHLFYTPLVMSLFKILCKCLFSEVTVQAVTELDNKAAHCHTPVLQRHRPFLGR